MTTDQTRGPVRHDYVPQMSWLGDAGYGYSAHCACGWKSAYTHAGERFAYDDWVFHQNNETGEQ